MMEKDFILTPKLFKTLRTMSYVLNTKETGEEGEILYDCITDLFNELKEEGKCSKELIDEAVTPKKELKE